VERDGQNLVLFEAQLVCRLPPAISTVGAPNSLPEFPHGPLNDERGLGIRLFRFLLTGLAMTILCLEFIANSWPFLQTNTDVVGPQTHTQPLLIPIYMRCSQHQAFMDRLKICKSQ
jgi:hypothetical protein